MKLQTKILIYLGGSFALAGLLVALLVGLRTWRDLSDQSVGQMRAQSALLVNMLDSYRQQSERLANDHMKVLGQSFNGHWHLARETPVAGAGVELPALQLNDRTLNGETAALDRFTATLGSVATIFVRQGDAFYRIATSLKREDGQRAVGTALGNAHPAQALLLRGEVYLGRARLFGRDYMTRYEPVRDARGEVVGALFVGVDFTDSLKTLKDEIKGIRIGKEGYVFAFDVGRGESRGSMLIHPRIEGQNALTLKDGQDELFLAKVADQAEGFIQYRWRDPQRGLVDKYSIFRTFAPWDLQVHISIDADEVHALSKQTTQLIIAAMFVAALLLAVLAAWLVRRLVLRPLGGEPQDAAALAARIAAGDLSGHIVAPAGSMLDSLAQMQQRLREVFSGIIDEAGAIARRSESLAAASREIGEAASSQAEATSAAAASLEQLTVSIDEMTHTAQATEQNSQRVAALSTEGAAIVHQAAERIGAVRSTVVDAAAQIRLLQSRSQEIGGIAGVIREIAEQTNLLDLNAAIEAARAGEQGRGFAVVADEVRKLAERTGTATNDIAQMIERVQQETGQAVLGMEAAVPQVEDGRRMADAAADVLGEILAQANESLTRVREVAHATAQQASTATDIAQRVEHIAGMAEEANATMQHNATDALELDRIAGTLRTQVSRYRV